MLTLLKAVFKESVIFGPPGTPDTPLHAQLTPAANEAKVAIIVGSNASGKSLGIRRLAARLNEEKTEPLQVSMRYRTQEGMARSIMFGPFGDSIDSTGAVSMCAIGGALRTAQSRETACWVMLDEPDVGMSEDFTYSLGQFLAKHVNEGLGPKCGGLVVVTHSRELVKGLAENLVAAPHFVHVDEEPQSLEAWVSGRRRRSVDELEGLNKKSVEVHRKLMPFFKGG